MTRTLYLWTERGAARHAKMLNTDRAWEVFEILEDTYFNPALVATVPAISAPKAKRLPNPNRRAGQFKDARVYVAHMSNTTVKVGISHDVEERLTNIKSKYHLEYTEKHYTRLMSRKMARRIETTFKKIFSSSKMNGEFFYVKFDMACAVVDALTEFAESFPTVSDFERGNKLFQIAGMVTDATKRQAILIQAKNLITDKFD